MLLLLGEARGELTAPNQVIMSSHMDEVCPDNTNEDFDPFS